MAQVKTLAPDIYMFTSTLTATRNVNLFINLSKEFLRELQPTADAILAQAVIDTTCTRLVAR